MRSKVAHEPDFVAIKRVGFSLAALLERYPDGCPNKVIEAALMLPEGTAQQEYERVVLRLRTLMGVSLLD